MSKIDEQIIIEDGVAEIYRGLYRLRKDGKYQEEYDAMGTVISMLMKDREFLRTNYKVKV